MALSNLGELKESVADWLNREDIPNLITDFIRLAQTRIAADIRSRGMWNETKHREILADAAQVNPYTPGDIDEVHEVSLDGKRMKGVIWAEWIKNKLDPVYNAGVYTFANNKLYLTNFYDADETPDGSKPSVELEVYGWIPPIFDYTDTASTNGLLDAHPNAWLYATLIEASVYLRDPEGAMMYQARYDDIMTSLDSDYRRAKMANLRQVRASQGEYGKVDNV